MRVGSLLKRSACVVLLTEKDEISSIQQQLSELKLNPYPEMKVVCDESDPAPAGPCAFSSSQDFNSVRHGQDEALPSPYHQHQQYYQGLQEQPEHAAIQLEGHPPNPVSHADLVGADFYHDTDRYTQQHQESLSDEMEMKMAIQFMMAMQKSVQQVVNTRHFGFEWVTPNYSFEAPAKMWPQDDYSCVSDQKEVDSQQRKAIEQLYDVIEDFVSQSEEN